MRSNLLRLALAVCASAIPSLASAQFTTISLESFDYAPGGLGGQGGGIGWANTWWSGGAGTDALVTAGGCDAVGIQATTALSDAGSYRVTDLAPHGDVVDPGAGGNGQDVLGADGTTIWISFCAGRVSDDLYGGFSLFNQGCCESLFMGAPFNAFLWGLQENPGGGGTVHTVAGSNIDATSTLVYRFDFMPGPERARLWINPGTAHPNTAADLDVSIADFRFNEVRIQSGQGPTSTGYEFDVLHVEKQTGGGPVSVCFGDGGGANCGCGNNGASGEGCASSLGMGAILSASGNASLSNDSLVLTTIQTTNQPGIYFQGDLLLSSPSTFGDGIRCCGQNVVRVGTYLPAGNTTNTATGNLIGGIGAPISTHPGNSGLTAGDSRCYQWWYRDPGGLNPCGVDFFNLSNAVWLIWGA